MVYEDIYIRSKGEKICLTFFYKNEEIKNKEKEKPCIIFLPGTMANPFTYWNFLDEMVKYDVVIAGVHFVGHGKSSRKKKDYTIYDLKQNVRDAISYVRDNIEKYGNSIVLFGHSQGGILASSLIGENLNIDKYILGNLVDSQDKKLKNIIGLENIPKIYIPFVKFFIKIYGKIFKTKTIGFADYVKNAQEDEEINDDPLKLTKYPMSMVTSLITMNTKNLTKPKRKIKEKIIVILSSNDPIFPLDIEKRAYDNIKAKHKKLIIFDSNVHMIYTEYPKETCRIIYENL